MKIIKTLTLSTCFALAAILLSTPILASLTGELFVEEQRDRSGKPTGLHKVSIVTADEDGNPNKTYSVTKPQYRPVTTSRKTIKSQRLRYLTKLTAQSDSDHYKALETQAKTYQYQPVKANALRHYFSPDEIVGLLSQLSIIDKHRTIPGLNKRKVTFTPQGNRVRTDSIRFIKSAEEEAPSYSAMVRTAESKLINRTAKSLNTRFIDACNKLDINDNWNPKLASAAKAFAITYLSQNRFSPQGLRTLIEALESQVTVELNSRSYIGWNILGLRSSRSQALIRALKDQLGKMQTTS